MLFCVGILGMIAGRRTVLVSAGTVKSLATGLIAVTLALAFEAIAVAVAVHDRLTGPWELRAALSGIVPIAVVTAAPTVVLSVLLIKLVDGESAVGMHVRRRVALSIACIGACAVAYGLTFGRHFQQLAVRVGAIAAVVACTAVIVWWLFPSVARVWRMSMRGVSVSCAVAAVAVQFANHVILPRLYPAFHIALSCTYVALVVIAAQPFADLLTRRAAEIASIAVFVVAAAVSPLSLRVMASWDNVRMLYIANAPTLSHAVRIAAVLQAKKNSPELQFADSDMEPSLVLGAAFDDVSSAAHRPVPSWLDWRDRDLLLVTVDALRADHLGTYGYSRRTTPQIDAIAAMGVVFEHAYTSMPHTSYAVTSLQTGKHIRPLLMQGVGQDSDTIAALLRTIGYRTAAFYPPSLFAVDEDKFGWASASGFDFEYRKVEYMSASLLCDRAMAYLGALPRGRRVFIWTHFFEPHEPYVAHDGYDFGSRAVDRYDGEIAVADVSIGALVRGVLERRPDTVVVITADHGEAFGDHGAYYHGTTVYEEQVRVPLIVVARGLGASRVQAPVQLVDVMPTVLRAMGIPSRPRVRGIDIGAWMVGKGAGDGFAFAETHDQAMLADGKWRLVCERKIDACSLFDLADDPGQNHDVSAVVPDRFTAMKKRLRSLDSSHGVYEKRGSAEEGKGLPPALLRAMAGDVQAAMETSGLLDDADVVIRRKAAEALFALAREETSPFLALAVSRDEDERVRRWCALALARTGRTVPMVAELLDSADLEWRRLAALVLAESGDGRGERVLVEWWESDDPSLDLRKDIARAFGVSRSRNAVVPLLSRLGDERLRPVIAKALAEIGDSYARVPLLRAFATERYVNNRLVLAQAVVALGGSREMAQPLGRFLGVPDPLDGGVGVAIRAGILDSLGGPGERAMKRIESAGLDGVEVGITVPRGGNGTGYRFIVRVRGTTEDSSLRFGLVDGIMRHHRMDPSSTVQLTVPKQVVSEIHATLSASLKIKGGTRLRAMIVPEPDVRVEGFVVIPFDDEIPPPPPELWVPESGDADYSEGSIGR